MKWALMWTGCYEKVQSYHLSGFAFFVAGLLNNKTPKEPKFSSSWAEASKSMATK